MNTIDSLIEFFAVRGDPTALGIAVNYRRPLSPVLSKLNKLSRLKSFYSTHASDRFTWEGTDRLEPYTSSGFNLWRENMRAGAATNTARKDALEEAYEKYKDTGGDSLENHL